MDDDITMLSYHIDHAAAALTAAYNEHTALTDALPWAAYTRTMIEITIDYILQAQDTLHAMQSHIDNRADALTIRPAAQ